MTTKKVSKTKKARNPKSKRHPIIFDYDKVERLAGLGLSQEKISIALGCSARTVNNRLNDDSEFANAFARGRASREVIVADKLAENCDNGDTSAIKFYLQAVAGWKERQDVSMQADVKASHTVDLKAMSVDELLLELDRLEAK